MTIEKNLDGHFFLDMMFELRYNESIKNEVGN